MNKSMSKSISLLIISILAISSFNMCSAILYSDVCFHSGDTVTVTTNYRNNSSYTKNEELNAYRTEFGQSSTIIFRNAGRDFIYPNLINSMIRNNYANFEVVNFCGGF